MTSRIIVWCVLIGLIAYDIPTAYLGRTTISEAIRQVDWEVNGLLRWSMLALWLHWFIKTWYAG
jgi:hypothetical protein